MSGLLERMARRRREAAELAPPPEQDPVAYVPEEHDPPTEVFALNGNGHHPDAEIAPPAPVPAFFAPEAVPAAETPLAEIEPAFASAAEPAPPAEPLDSPEPASGSLECWVDPTHADPPVEEEEVTPEMAAIAEPQVAAAPVELPEEPVESTAEVDEPAALEPSPSATRRWPKLSRRGARPDVKQLPEPEPEAEATSEMPAADAEATAELNVLEAAAIAPEPVAPEALAPEPLAPEPVAPEPLAPEPVAPPAATVLERGRIRRRARYLRQLREVQLRDIGGFALELHRYGRHRADLVDAKVAVAAETDRELRALEHALARRSPIRDLREAGIGGTCAKCGAVHGSADRFCAACGTPLAGSEPAA
jgi:hypothetical protein